MALRKTAFPWGLCPAQRIEIFMTAGGSHTISGSALAETDEGRDAPPILFVGARHAAAPTKPRREVSKPWKITPPQSARRADSSPYTPGALRLAVRFYRLRKAYTKSPQQSGVFRFAEGAFSSFTL